MFDLERPRTIRMHLEHAPGGRVQPLGLGLCQFEHFGRQRKVVY